MIQNKLLWIILIFIIVSLVGVSIYLWGMEKSNEDDNPFHIFSKDEFIIEISDNWKEVVPSEGVLASFVINKEDDAGKYSEGDFRENFSITSDQLNERNLVEYKDYVKSIILQINSKTQFENDKEIKISNQFGYIIESQMKQNEADFKNLLAVIGGEGEKVWVLAFNSTLENWADYQNIFRNIIMSFKINK